MVTKRWTVEEADGHLRDVLDEVAVSGPQEVTGDGRTFLVVTTEDWQRRPGDQPTFPGQDQSEPGEELTDVLERERAKRWANAGRDDEEWERTRNPFGWVNEVTDEEFDTWAGRMDEDHARRRALWGPTGS